MVKDPALFLLCCGFNPWPRSLLMAQAQPKKKKQNKKNQKIKTRLIFRKSTDFVYLHIFLDFSLIFLSS